MSNKKLLEAVAMDILASSDNSRPSMKEYNDIKELLTIAMTTVENSKEEYIVEKDLANRKYVEIISAINGLMNGLKYQSIQLEEQIKIIDNEITKSSVLVSSRTGMLSMDRKREALIDKLTHLEKLLYGNNAALSIISILLNNILEKENQEENKEG